MVTLAEAPISSTIPTTSRFAFGRNWADFLKSLNDERIHHAEESLKSILSLNSLDGKRFLDVGSGSGLFSLAAARLGASVYSFDYDNDSVACAQELKKFLIGDSQWIITQGSILDSEYIKSLGTFDIVYSWGVLHHTGDMWRGFELIKNLVAPGGLLCIAIYNDQGMLSKVWRAIKRLYNEGGTVTKWGLLLSSFVALHLADALFRLLTLRNPFPFARWQDYKQRRGMSVWHDHVDWIGGYPFEVAKPEEVFSFFHQRKFELERLVTKGGGSGCCEYVFRRKEVTAH